MPSQSPILSSKNIFLNYDKREILKDINISLRQGEIIGVVGKSGAGKSSLMKILAGLMNADSGAVYFRNKPLIDPREQLIRGHSEIKLVNQDFDLDLFHTVEENLRVKLLGYTEDTKAALIHELLNVIDLKDLSKQQVRWLSGGEQQRLALARALIVEPDVLLLDEPFVHLDPALRVKIESFIRDKIKAWNGAAIIVTHNGQEAMAWADKIAYFKDGALLRLDSPEAFYWQPKSIEEAAHFGEINALDYKRQQYLFRPNAYKLSEKGITVKKLNSRFLGTHIASNYKTVDNQEIVLYSQQEMDDTITIEPQYVAKK
jgi:ABC-type sulfate/molybdate transport systems ATPase subunit